MRNAALLWLAGLWHLGMRILNNQVEKKVICWKSCLWKMLGLCRYECMGVVLCGALQVVHTKNTAICHSGLKILEKQAWKQAKTAGLLAFVMVFFNSVKAIKGLHNNRLLAQLGNSKNKLKRNKHSWLSGEMLLTHFKATQPCWSSTKGAWDEGIWCSSGCSAVSAIVLLKIKRWLLSYWVLPHGCTIHMDQQLVHHVCKWGRLIESLRM